MHLTFSEGFAIVDFSLGDSFSLTLFFDLFSLEKKNGSTKKKLCLSTKRKLVLLHPKRSL
jgi:hypothetical protein